MRLTVSSRSRKLAACALAGVLAFLAAAYVMNRYAVWSTVLAWLMTTQAELHRQLAAAIRVVAQEGLAATWPLIGISLLYGVFHAAGPGHGKAVIATYLGTSRTRLRRGLVLSIGSAIAQGVVAIVLVEVLASLLSYSLRRTQGAAAQLENISFALIAMLGAVWLLRSARMLYKRWRQPERSAGTLFSGGGKMQAYCADCGGLHRLAGAHIDQPLTWRASVPIVLAIGLRPCTGAILVLLVAYSLGLRWVGMAAVLAMSLGTAATVSLLATAAVSLRQGALRFFQRGAKPRLQTGVVFDVLGVIGGTTIFLLGIGLLQQGLKLASHPLF
ncbi:nickel/cobalt transporter [Pusillimonas sp. SM2304]|uniref:nickel/cobalt transporter n=1 Tax=Pusillimonas sp. SM2304 TaxID=3073241 RepID=UPI0028765AB2|nr:nickel/cobalt transporter [Pusillimonas sp. SM2304]MDS1141396.1 nickel/cobalt transporter [Pusillimonas sp. SM2304]